MNIYRSNAQLSAGRYAVPGLRKMQGFLLTIGGKFWGVADRLPVKGIKMYISDIFKRPGSSIDSFHFFIRNRNDYAGWNAETRWNEN